MHKRARSIATVYAKYRSGKSVYPLGTESMATKLATLFAVIACFGCRDSEPAKPEEIHQHEAAQATPQEKARQESAASKVLWYLLAPEERGIRNLPAQRASTDESIRESIKYTKSTHPTRLELDATEAYLNSKQTIADLRRLASRMKT